jgi:hypothetical protein
MLHCSKERTMKKFLVSLAAVGLGLAISVAQGGERNHSNRTTSNDRSSNSATTKDSKDTKKYNTFKTTYVNHTSTLKVGADGFKSELITKNNSHTKYFDKQKLDPKYKEKFGKEFKYKVDGESKKAFCYPGKHHHHWDYRCWNEHYRCWFYWDPCTLGFFYWYPKCNCWAPVACVPDCVPDCTGDASDGADSSLDDMTPPDGDN